MSFQYLTLQRRYFRAYLRRLVQCATARSGKCGSLLTATCTLVAVCYIISVSVLYSVRVLGFFFETLKVNWVLSTFTHLFHLICVFKLKNNQTYQKTLLTVPIVSRAAWLEYIRHAQVSVAKTFHRTAHVDYISAIWPCRTLWLSSPPLRKNKNHHSSLPRSPSWK